MTECDAETIYLGLQVRIAAAWKRGSEDTAAMDRADVLWRAGAGRDGSILKDGCLYLADCVADWPESVTHPEQGDK